MLSTLAVDRKRIADIDSKILEIGDDCAELLFEKDHSHGPLGISTGILERHWTAGVSLLDATPSLLALDGGRESPATAFADAPLLRSLSIRNNRFSYLWPPITLPWLQFTSLALDTSVLRSFAPMLKEFQNLTFFELTISNHGDLSDRDHIRLARLESLTLKDKRLPVIDSWREPHRILQHLVTPALQRLVVSTSIITRWRSDSAISALISFIKASACNLEELCITVTGNDIHLCDVERDLPVYRRAFPAIPKISLQTCTSTGEH
ncbi:hypothetical protein R3P38DRAFT_3197595 [Favolaschia claudopus]|uniref:Uncharacterized protein n=1 Tax=Favolaschia claudopus TaxID=2862362 RepID=A0AAW0B3Q2_9AGAR